mmetsp:Transcript_20579/g.40751  ORF Transcript_20579/g.40751 Transcript_20579/m.40751 type:complete len:206 (-) Transcript_20579:441-1058(-)|eukprot:CAMPEP_0175141322 /NCGR_PEP_ID=MMETSP0087-20121206/12045_1 /TAXON_ID=136419 /ORGANISM="Unknown Unknown, Strain D1" /LENGTH=205 /DNA_ID=CAMNT_0016424733 /DNA_START=43 /DNA_END=660 /DNA_ORIENTATION=+
MSNKKLDPEKKYGDDQIGFRDSYYQAWAQSVEDRRTHGFSGIVKWGTLGYAVPIGMLLGYAIMKRVHAGKFPSYKPQRLAAVLTEPHDIIKFNQLRLSSSWPDTLSTLKAHHIKNLAVYRKDVQPTTTAAAASGQSFLFSRFDYCGNDLDMDLEQLYENPQTENWLKLWGAYQDESGAVKFPVLEEYYHDGHFPDQFEPQSHTTA